MEAQLLFRNWKQFKSGRLFIVSHVTLECKAIGVAEGFFLKVSKEAIDLLHVSEPKIYEETSTF